MYNGACALYLASLIFELLFDRGNWIIDRGIGRSQDLYLLKRAEGTITPTCIYTEKLSRFGPINVQCSHKSTGITNVGMRKCCDSLSCNICHILIFDMLCTCVHDLAIARCHEVYKCERVGQ